MAIEIVEKKYGNVTYYGYHNVNGYLVPHNINGPAVIWNNGRKEWKRYGVLHREDGPALIDDEFHKNVWAFEGRNITRKVEKWLSDRGIINCEDMTEEDKMALSFFMRSL